MAETPEEFVQEVKYEFDRLVAQTCLTDEFWREAEAPSITAHMMWDHLYSVIMRWPIAKRELLTYRWPITWRDAFKERWFPKWAKARWPIRYRRIDLTELAAIDQAQFEDTPLRYHTGIGREREPDA